MAEPVIQQQGADRVVVQLPGVQDTAKAKDIIGRTATLEMRMVDDSAEGRSAESGAGPVPFGSEKYIERSGAPVIVKRQVIVTGESLTDAQPGFDGQTQEPAVHLTMDAKGARIMRDVSRENIGKRMAILLFEKGKGEVVTAPVIRGELGNRFQISGRMTTAEANDTALLLRAGSLAAPMEIIEERTIGPSLGAENIDKGFQSVIYGFAAIALFMCAYYLLFGLVSTLALGFNLLLLVAVLSMLQATLTLPGIAAIALTLGMAIDANVLINERVREELRGGASPQAAINTGYERAFATILDSNVTTLIAGLALLAFGSGPVRGFAIVHCLGIVTSMFSAVMFSRGLVNLWYGRQKRLKSVSIGQVWKPGANVPASASPDPALAHSPRPEKPPNGVLPHPPRHPVHAARVDLQHRVGADLPRRGLLPRHPRPALLDRVHRRHGDRDRLRPAGRRQQGARHGREARPRRRAGAELRQLARRDDPGAAARRHQAGRPGGPGLRRALRGRGRHGRRRAKGRSSRASRRRARPASPARPSRCGSRAASSSARRSARSWPRTAPRRSPSSSSAS